MGLNPPFVGDLKSTLARRHLRAAVRVIEVGPLDRQRATCHSVVLALVSLGERGRQHVLGLIGTPLLVTTDAAPPRVAGHLQHLLEESDESSKPRATTAVAWY